MRRNSGHSILLSAAFPPGAEEYACMRWRKEEAMSYQSPKIDVVTELSSMIRGIDGIRIDCDKTGIVECGVEIPVTVEEV